MANHVITHFGGKIPSVICMAYTAFSDEINNRKKIMANTVTALDIYCLSQKQKNPYPRNGRYGFYIFIGRGRIQTSPYKHSIFNLHLLYHRRLREAITGRSSGSRIVLLITPSHPIKAGQWYCDVRSRLQRRGRPPSRFVKRDMDSLLLPTYLRENYL